jgi:phospholipid transport system substrate-binding protein
MRRSVAAWAVAAGVALATAAHAPLTRAQEAQGEGPLAFLQARHREVEHVLRASDAQAQREAALLALLDAHIDFEEFARRSLGYQWMRLTEAQQAEYQGLLRALLERTHARRLLRRSPHYKVSWGAVAVNQGRARVSLMIYHNDEEMEVDFDLRRHNTTWALLDVSYDGLSAAASYQKNYAKVLREEGFEALTARMRQRLNEL